MWQDRARTLLSRARTERLIIAMGDPVGIVDAGRWSESSNNLSRALRPAMESGELTLICECDPASLDVVAKKEPSFIEAFHRINLHEPRDDEATRIVAAAARRFESTHGIALEESATTAAIQLTSRFEPYKGLPGKAVRLLAETVHLGMADDDPGPLDREDVVAAFSQRTGLPRNVLSDELTLDLAEATDFLERRVLGQPDAVTTMVDLLAVVKAGLHDPTKPLGSYFFVGPTGVGKTELAKATAELLFGGSDRLIRFDMGEYQSGDAVAKLIGSGWQDANEGELTRRVREQPFSIVLLDEIEKAHSDVFDSLLAVLGEGRLTDASGRTADFRNTLVIMTSNLGAADADTQSIGFAPSGTDSLNRRRQHFLDAAERFFRPEFFNRIDRVVVFGPLEKEIILRIARREIGNLVMREGITRRQLLVEIDDGVVDHCAERGFHPKYGARPLQREIERAVAQPLARIVVSQGPGSGDLIRFRIADGEVIAELVHPAVAPELTPRRDTARLRSEATIARALSEVSALQERLEQDGRDPSLLAVQEESGRLLAVTHEPSFWDDPVRAREILARYYDLANCIERLTTLTKRVDGLVGLVQTMKAENDTSRLPEVRDAVDEIEDTADLLRLELHGAAAGSAETDAIVHIKGIGPDTDGWALELLRMYENWAARTGREVSGQHHPNSLLIQGVASYQLLLGDTGLHRRILDHGPSLLARVTVRQPANDDRDIDPDTDSAEIVRQYHEGRRQYVKDPRTGVRSTNVRAVLDDGKIDAFLLARARIQPRVSAVSQ
jgi:hypothetical protein